MAACSTSGPESEGASLTTASAMVRRCASAQATAAAIYYARRVRDRAEIARLLQTQFGYDLGIPLDEIRPTYRFDETCQGTVPQALRAFLKSTGYEDAIRNAVSLGGDADTLACITGGVAEA